MNYLCKYCEDAPTTHWGGICKPCEKIAAKVRIEEKRYYANIFKQHSEELNQRMK